ncbi:glycoprotein-N-acetylgalactosamine 3-beta-galactosyltransferase 1-like [Anopheles marshallii]|uniref:glycoprotein-N-acetylgalactosamine 3-beta-galactosyltransferase 1-like n=1 Tax=Anopheles marshallii TaxID=1521116 RepID=UPI00237A111A|nr:glycoprotein-N-acetylgalactosamine 3-beta-galactosyltransferase 1-like [Anopheles marshallii]
MMLKVMLKKLLFISPRYSHFLFGILCGWILSRVAYFWSTTGGTYLETTGWITGRNRLSNHQSAVINMTESVRVLCWVMTAPANHQDKVVHIKATWGARCNKLLIMSSVEDADIGSIALPVEEGRENLWNKTREAFRYIYEHHLEEYDWFFKADDDTYVVVENLRYFLYPYSPELPIYFGSKFRYPEFVKQGYFSGGAGYVLSREAVRRFYEQSLQDEEHCSAALQTEDLEMGKCMESVNVTAGDSRDDYGRKRFLPLDPVLHLTDSLAEYPDFWYYNYSYYEPLYGKSCCSDLAISFHYISGKTMHMMDYLIYDLHAWGSHYRSPPLAKRKTPKEAMVVAGPYPLSTFRPETETSTHELTKETSHTASFSVES